MLARTSLALSALTGVSLLLGGAPVFAADSPSGELRLVHESRQIADAGPLHSANSLQPGTAALVDDRSLAELELRHRLDARVAGLPLSLGLNALARARHDAWSDSSVAPGSPTDTVRRSGLRVNEIDAGADLGAWQLSAGKKVVSWDVGWAFRPNDVVQQEARRSLLPTPLEGRPLLMAEGFGADDALALVWVHPRRVSGESAGQTSGQAAATGATSAARAPGDEQALALRAYRRIGTLDLHGFARQGEHSGASLGAAGAWVVGDALELHGSARYQRRHVGWAASGADTAPDALLRSNPWQATLLGPASQALLGLQWTGESQLGLLAEAWHDGSAPSAADWRAWAARNAALATGPAPTPARAGNLAWQATPLGSAGSLQRDNLLLRLAWQPPGWQVSVDTLYTPADHGRQDTAALQWQGDRWRLNAAWRQAGGPADALARQLPTQRTLALSAAWAF